MKTKRKSNREKNERGKIARCPGCNNEYTDKSFGITKKIVKCPFCDIDLVMGVMKDTGRLFQKRGLQ